MAIHLGRPSPNASCNQPEWWCENPPADNAEAPGRPFLLGFAPGGVYHASRIAEGPVRSYRTLSPFPTGLRCVGGLLSVALSLGSPPPDVIWHRVSVEPGLSSPVVNNKGSHPAIWWCGCRSHRSERQAKAMGWETYKAAYLPIILARAVAIDMHCPSSTPEMFSGRQWR